MRTFLLSTLSLAALTSAHAGDTYLGMYGGINRDDVISAPFVDSKDGFVVGGTFGTKVLSIPGLRVEADLSFRQNEVEIFGGFINADHDTTALLGNLAYDVPVAIGPIAPYVLAGIGWARTSATFEDIALLRLEAAGLAWQVGGGINATVSPGVTLGVGYRYFQGPELNPLSGIGFPELSDGSNQSVVAEVRFAL